LEKHVVKQVRDFLAYRGWRPVHTGVIAGPGFSMGEPGRPDYLFLYYQEAGCALALWVEMKSPNDKRRCNCAAGKLCKVCRQKIWHDRERMRGAVVWVVSDFDAFAAAYEASYGWLHSGATGRGQLDLLAGVSG
jgi:hypothetical protein